MRHRILFCCRTGFVALVATAAGCSSVPDWSADYRPLAARPVAPASPATVVKQVGHQELAEAKSGSVPAQVDEWVQLAVARNPRLAKATFAIDAAQGKYAQAGMYPNPVLAVTGDELGDRTGPSGIITAPQVSQEIVTGRKLKLSQVVVAREVDQSTLALLQERYAVVGSVRAAFYDLYALERRVAVLDELVKVAADAVKTGQTLLTNNQIARLDLIQLEVEFARFKSLAESARREVPEARKRLAAVAGDPRLSVGSPAGPYEDVPLYDHDRTRELVLATHPEVRSARVGVDRAQAAVRRAEAEPIPNVTVSTGYTYQGQNRSNDWLLGASVPVPVWNRNQGNIRAAKAELGAAVQDVGRVENDLAERVATALRAHAAAVTLAEEYRREILPRAEETFTLSLGAFKGGQFEYLRVIQAQRAVAEARLEYNRALGDGWKAAAELSALLLEEWWPGPPPAPGSGKPPAALPAPKPAPTAPER